MKFKSHNQRKAVMCKLNGGKPSSSVQIKSKSPYAPSIIAEGKKLVELEDKLNVLNIRKEVIARTKPFDEIKHFNVTEKIQATEDSYFALRYKTEKDLKKSFKDLKKKNKKINPNGDLDGDGIKNKNDCKPLDVTKQGKLHDMALARLRKQENKLEVQRRKVEKKLESQKEIFNVKKGISDKKIGIKTAMVKQKQVIIDEINREKKQIKNLKNENTKIKKEIFSQSKLGKVKNVSTKISKKSLAKTQKFFDDPKNKKKARNIWKKVNKYLDDF